MALKFKKINGMSVVMATLNKEIINIKGRSMEGMIESAKLIRRDMEETPPKIPVDTGNLRSSWFATPFFFKRMPAVKMGFTAKYALWVHEMMGSVMKVGNIRSLGGKAINWKRPGSGPKFFESALNRNKDKILEIIHSKAKIK